jgi:hypothetical protein
MNLPPGCRSGAVQEEGMENREPIDTFTPIYGESEDYLAHI